MFIFDFDGVLVDSVDETAVTAYNSARGNLATSSAGLPEGYLRLFRLNRCRIRNAAELVLLGRWCLSNCVSMPLGLLDAAEAKSVLSVSGSESRELAELFFSARTRLMSSNRKAWLLLTSPFEPLWGVLKENFEDEVIILTNKNRAAVEELTAFYGLKIPPHNIYAADGGLSKEERMSSIAERFPHESIVVVEDSLENLKALGEAAPRGISFSGVLASWGYLAPDDTEEAGRLGFQVLTQKELMDRL